MKKIFLLSIFVIAAACIGLNCVQDKTLTLADIRIRDPFILADTLDQTYYMYAQMSNRLNAEPDARGVEVYQSKDLETWTGPEPVFEVPQNFWAQKAVWAPEVHQYKGKYYLFVTFTSEDSLQQRSGRPPLVLRGTQILASDSPTGPFKPFHDRPHTPRDWMALDGTLWVEDNVPWMIFCHEWVQIMDGTLELVPLKPDLSDILGDPVTLFSASDAAWSRNLKSLGVKYRDQLWDGYVTDGPFLYRTRNGKLLMIWSSFGDEKYAIGIAVSESGKVTGPWTNLPEPLIDANGGHGMLFRTFDGQLMLVFHQPNTGPNERAQLYTLIDTGDMIRLEK